MDISIIGAGRAGQSFSHALSSVGHTTSLVHHDVASTPALFPVVLLTVPDRAVSEVASSITPSPDRVIIHVAGALGLGVLTPHPRVASLHPLAMLSSLSMLSSPAMLSSPSKGAARLIGASYAVSGDPVAWDLVRSLSGHPLAVSESDRPLYHATAVVTANHLVVLMAQVQRLAEQLGLTLKDFLPLARQALDDVASLGSAAALTGPASRGDLNVIDAHLAALDESERALYVVLANAALQLGVAPAPAH